MNTHQPEPEARRLASMVPTFTELCILGAVVLAAFGISAILLMPLLVTWE